MSRNGLEVAEMPGRLDSMCRLCLVAAGRSNDPWDEWLRTANRFTTIASLGALVPGWALVLPNQHVTSFSDLSPDSLQLAELEVEMVARWMTATFGSPAIVFEHGASGEQSPSSCGTTHAHTHVVATDLDLKSLVLDDHWLDQHGIPALGWKWTGGRSELDPSSMDYIYLRAGPDQMVTLGDHLPSQYMRRVISSALGDPTGWNWRDSPHTAFVTTTIDRLKASAANTA